MNTHDFLLYIASEKGLSLNTRQAYERDTKKLVTFLKKQSVASFSEVSQEHLVDFLSHLKSKCYAETSIRRTLFAIKMLFRFLKREGVLEKDETAYLGAPKIWQLIPEILTLEELESLFEACDKTTLEGARDLAILELFYASGLRVSEVCSLTIYAIDDAFVKVMGKGRKERIVPIGKKALLAIDHYLIHFRDHNEEDRHELLFVTKKKQPLTRMMIWNRVKFYAKKAGITKNISPHTFRHSFATHLLDNGADIRVIQEVLGHASIGTTDRYTQISKTHLQASFEAHHPRLTAEKE